MAFPVTREEIGRWRTPLRDEGEEAEPEEEPVEPEEEPLGRPT